MNDDIILYEPHVCIVVDIDAFIHIPEQYPLVNLTPGSPVLFVSDKVIGIARQRLVRHDLNLVAGVFKVHLVSMRMQQVRINTSRRPLAPIIHVHSSCPHCRLLSPSPLHH